MFDAKKLLDQFLGSQVPGTTGSVKQKAGDVVQLAKDNPLATGAIAAVLLGTKTGRSTSTGNAPCTLGGLAAIAGSRIPGLQELSGRQVAPAGRRNREQNRFCCRRPTDSAVQHRGARQGVERLSP